MKKRTFRLLSLFISFIMVTMLLPGQTAKAATFSDGMFTYTVSDGNATITGLANPLYSGPLTLPSTISDGSITYDVTTIGSKAFYQRALTGPLTIPDSVTTIGDWAFYNCRGLTDLTIGNGVKFIGEYAFTHCIGLTCPLTIPDSVTSIGYSAFYGCIGLKGPLTLGNRVTYIGSSTFWDCRGLTGPLTIPDSMTSIDSKPFSGLSGITHINVSSEHPSLSSMDGIIYNKVMSELILCPEGKVGQISIPDSVTSIKDAAFVYCSGLTGPLTIPDTVTTIGNAAFYRCSGLTGTLTIPDTVTIIKGQTFEGCSGLTGPLTIPDTVTSIGPRAFYGCTGLTELTIGNSVTSIHDNAFNLCSNISKITAKPVSAPTLYYSAQFDNIPSTTVLYTPNTPASNTSYDVLPWSRFVRGIVDQEPSQDLSGPLAVSLFGDASVRVTENEYDPNPFVVTAFIEKNNLLLDPGLSESVMASINLPNGLKLVSTETATKSLGTINNFQKKQVSWSVQIDPSSNDKTLEYSVDVWSGLTSYTKKTVKKSIFIPKIEGINPIIILPGIMGSRLFSDQECTKIAWSPKDAVLSTSSLNENMHVDNPLFVRPPENQNLAGVVREYGAMKEYEGLVNRLCTDFPGREIYFFSYDFRQSNLASANKLKEFIDDTLKVNKVDLVCHSMGGIVASIYAANDANFNKINKIITLGTPYEGAPMIYDVMLSNDVLDDTAYNNNIKDQAFNSSANALMYYVGGVTQIIKRGLKGAFELVPSIEYQLLERFTRTGLNNSINVVDLGLFDAINKGLFPIFTDALNAQEKIQEGKIKLRNSLKSYYGVGIHPDKRTIIGGKFEGNKIIFGDLDFENIGDGTVPNLSAIQMGALYDLPLGRLRGFDLDHGGLHKNSDPQDWVVDILNGVNDLSYTYQAPTGKPYTIVRVACPVDATITLDGEKLSSAPSDQVTVSDFGELYLLGENNEIKLFALDDNKSYDIELVGTDAGTMDYSIKYFDENNEKFDERIFNDVPITNQTVIKTGSDNAEKISLHIDTNGDGADDGLWVSERSNSEGKEVDKTPPEIVCSIVNDYEVLPIGTSVEFSGSDPNNDVPVSIMAMLSTGNGETEEVNNGFSPTEGVYELKITATDDSGNKTEKVVNFVIYNPEGQFVTGGGWINSPSGAYTINTDLSGVATFGFVSKYKKGATVPTGQTEFKFEAANMEFYASNYQWLVVAGSKVQFKGTGTINGSGNYGFMVTATDGQQTKKEDRFRIKIWDIETDETVYDNQIGTDVSAEPGQSTVLGGGSISIHK